MDATDTTVDPAAVSARLDRVDDPELDRSIVDLEYIEQVDIHDGRVEVRFVLPTAWCSPAFAWMMATGIRDEVSGLPAVEEVTVRLRDHMHGEEITGGVNAGRSFQEVFEDAEDGVDAVREKLDEKARFARQFEAITALERAGLQPEQIAALTLGDLELEAGLDRVAIALPDRPLSITVPREPLVAYLEKARSTGLVGHATDRLFADRDGEPLPPDADSLAAVRREARLATANIEGQATICASLHAARNGVEITE